MAWRPTASFKRCSCGKSILWISAWRQQLPSPSLRGGALSSVAWTWVLWGRRWQEEAVSLPVCRSLVSTRAWVWAGLNLKLSLPLIPSGSLSVGTQKGKNKKKTTQCPWLPPGLHSQPPSLPPYKRLNSPWISTVLSSALLGGLEITFKPRHHLELELTNGVKVGTSQALSPGPQLF